MRVAASLEATPDESLPAAANRLLVEYPPEPYTRNAIQDVLWSDLQTPELNTRTRRELARVLTLEDLYVDQRSFDELLCSLFEVADDVLAPFLGGAYASLRASIQRHVYNRDVPWSVEQFFEEVGALKCSHRRFCLLLEGIVGPQVCPDEPRQRLLVELINRYLIPYGAELKEGGFEDGYPTFVVLESGSPLRAAKTIIFASHRKPDLRFKDVISRDVEVVSSGTSALAYDRPIGTNGLSWSELQAWWAEKEKIQSPEHAKATLYKRLLASLPANSPPQRLLFTEYFRHFGTQIPTLPALLPEVWLHWDPKTVAERGREALSRFRMDFLLLLRGGRRVVLEVDGQHHYADAKGLACPRRYADMTKADRDLRLAGYDVFRFGARELSDRAAARTTVANFFEPMFARYGVAPEA
jgi:hypothetical protein